MQALETHKRGEFVIEIHHDSDCSYDLAIGDAPIVLVTIGFGTFHEWNKDKRVSVPTREIIQALDSCNLQDLCDACGHDYEVLPDGRVAVEFRYEARKRYYKHENSAYAGIVRYEEIGDVMVKQYRVDGRERVYAVSSAKALADWSGNKDCDLSGFAEIQSYLDGDVYGYVIKRANGDDINEIGESVWGFIGDSEYALSEAESWLDWYVGDVAKQRRDKLKTLIRNHVPLQLRADMLAAIN